MSTFTVPATLLNPREPERGLTLDMIVDTGATWTLLPSEAVSQLGLETPRERTVVLASGERVTYLMGQVVMKLGEEELITIFLAGPSGCRPLLGAVTLEEFSLATDPVNKRLVPVIGILA